MIIDHSSADIIRIIADNNFKLNTAAKCGGDWFEFLDDNKIKEFDFLGQGEALVAGLELFQRSKRLPRKCFVIGDLSALDLEYARKRYGVPIYTLNQMTKNSNDEYLIIIAKWNWNVISIIKAMNYKLLLVSLLAEYSIYKHVVLKQCYEYLDKIGAGHISFKFPQATKIQNGSEFERFIADHSIYNFSPVIFEHGQKAENLAFGNGLYFEWNTSKKCYTVTDCKTESATVIGGHRVTTDIIENATNSIWVIGSSVAFGVCADDAHTIESALQRQLNTHFGTDNKWNVVNACAFSGADVGNVIPFIKNLPIKKGDICVFVMDFPDVFMESYDEVVDLSPYFARPHNWGEIFVDINHMTGAGYCKQGEFIFDNLLEKGYFDENKFNPNNPKEKQSFVQDSNEVLIPEDKKELAEYLDKIKQYKLKTGAIVMNCNPFTLGHRYLIETAAGQVDRLLVFVVEENSSMFDFEDRIELVRRGTAHLNNVVVLPSGSYMISKKTFAAYSNKANLQNEIIDPSMDVEIFADYVAPAMGIGVRFAGEEPLDMVTKQYNDAMKRILPTKGVEFIIIPRKESGGAPISASRVRKLLENKDFEAIKAIVPETTYEYLVERFS